MSRRYLRDFGLPAVVLATLYVACADPPKKINKGSGGAPGTAGMSVGDAGEDETAGSNAIGGKGGSGGMADDGAAGEGGAGEGGEAGAVETTGGKGGSGGAAQGGSGGAPVDAACTGLVVGGKSKMPPAPKTNQPKPSGAVGGFKVIDWAGFKAAISYTFDDSLLSQTTHYEELNAVGIPMTFYLVNGNQGSNAIWAKAVADGHELGNHTAHHCRANGKDCINAAAFTTLAQEIDDNTTFIMMKAGVTGVYTFANPWGDGGWQEEAKKRFFVARGVSDGINILPNNDAYAFDLPCHISNDHETAAGFNAITDDLRAKGAWRTILMHNVDPAITDYGYNPVETKEAVAAMTYTKSLPDMWADTVLAVAAYWRGQTKVSAAKPKVVGSDTTYSWTLPDNFPPGMYVRATVNGGKVKQCGTELQWDSHGYYEINLDAGSVTISP